MRRRGAVCPSFPGGRKSMFFARRMRVSAPFYFDGCKLSVFGQKRPQKARNFCINCLKHLTKIFGNGRITLATVWAQVFSRAKNLQFEKICGYHTAKTSRKKSPREQKSHHSDNFVVAQLRQFCINARKRSLRKIDFVRCERPRFARQAPRAEKGNATISIKGSPSKHRRRGKTSAEPPQSARRTVGFS